MGEISVNNHQDFMRLLASKVTKDQSLDAKEVREVSSHLNKLESFDRNLSKLALSEYAKQYGTAEAKTIVLGLDDDDIDTFQTALEQNNDQLAGKLMRNAYHDLANPKAGESDTSNAATFSRMVRLADDDVTGEFLREAGFAFDGKGAQDFDLNALRAAKSDDILALIGSLEKGWTTGGERKQINALYQAGVRLNDPLESGKFLTQARKALGDKEFTTLLKQADANATFQYLVALGAVDNTRATPQTVEKIMSQLPRETREIMVDNLRQGSFVVKDDARQKLIEDLYLSGMKTGLFSDNDLESARLAAKISDQIQAGDAKGGKQALLEKMVQAMDDDIAMHFVAQTGFRHVDAQGNVSWHADKLKHLNPATVKALADVIEKGWWDSDEEKAVVEQLRKTVNK